MANASDELKLRSADARDAAAIARLHADSWRRHYRSAYPEDFFGPRLDDERATVWTQRLAQPRGTATTLAETGGELVGFVHLVFNDDALWGTLLDNLHVRHDLQRRGVGRVLVQHAAHLTQTQTDGGMYLWVLEPNVRAQVFYRALGGREVARAPASEPALPGVAVLRYAWAVADLSPNQPAADA